MHSEGAYCWSTRIQPNHDRDHKGEGCVHIKIICKRTTCLASMSQETAPNAISILAECALFPLVPFWFCSISIRQQQCMLENHAQTWSIFLSVIINSNTNKIKYNLKYILKSCFAITFCINKDTRKLIKSLCTDNKIKHETCGVHLNLLFVIQPGDYCIKEAPICTCLPGNVSWGTTFQMALLKAYTRTKQLRSDMNRFRSKFLSESFGLLWVSVIFIFQILNIVDYSSVLVLLCFTLALRFRDF